MLVEITLEKTQRIAEVFDVTEEQVTQLENGINPFQDVMEEKLDSGNCEYDFAVADENGRTIVDWK